MKINPGLPLLTPLSNQATKPEAGTESFSAMLKSQLQKVEQSQIKADSLTQEMMTGGKVELHEVLIATEEARLMLELTMQVRNKVMEAYKEMMNMQL